jgi:hypothetical protein
MQVDVQQVWRRATRVGGGIIPTPVDNVGIPNFLG